MRPLQAREGEAAPTKFFSPPTGEKPEQPRHESEIGEEVDLPERTSCRHGLPGEATDKLRHDKQQERREKANE